MTRTVVGGMPDTAVAGAGGAGMLLNRRRSKARRRKRKELFGFQLCFAGLLLGLVAGLRSVSPEAGKTVPFHLPVKREAQMVYTIRVLVVFKTQTCL
ncbi:unnamed protein product [Tetraodon nigroviridis]|uniref:(spotted green pufferfish) hypothetical protein n=1 Tax=Tetraodon nigroviridis TaxID=99883 RepID=Q4S2I2_TETNG|nr:unnamed protein product [Tetraodon nigroviridis]